MRKYNHIAEIDYSDFYSSVFLSIDESKEFYDHLISIDTPAKVILHQAARMLYLAGIIHQQGRPALQVLFFLIAAESVAKLTFNYQGEGESRKYVKNFFKEICNANRRDRLSKAFKKQLSENNYLTLEETVDFLYDVRCDVVHRGKYFDNLWLKENCVEGNISFEWKNAQLISPNISTEELRNIILEGAVLGCRKALPEGDKYKL
ncbi:MAG: hypothetical protein ABIH71_05915 [Candidatus Omnitrophota bacterium]